MATSRFKEGGKEGIHAAALWMRGLDDGPDDAQVGAGITMFQNAIKMVIFFQLGETVGSEQDVADNDAPVTGRMLQQEVLMVAHPVRTGESAKAQMDKARTQTLAVIVGQLRVCPER